MAHVMNQANICIRFRDCRKGIDNLRWGVTLNKVIVCQLIKYLLGDKWVHCFCGNYMAIGYWCSGINSRHLSGLVREAIYSHNVGQTHGHHHLPTHAVRCFSNGGRLTGHAKLCLISVFFSSGGMVHWDFYGFCHYVAWIKSGKRVRICCCAWCSHVKFSTNWPATWSVILCLRVDTALWDWLLLWCKAFAQKKTLA